MKLSLPGTFAHKQELLFTNAGLNFMHNRTLYYERRQQHSVYDFSAVHYRFIPPFSDLTNDNVGLL